MKNALCKIGTLILALSIVLCGILSLAGCAYEEIEAESGKKADTPEKVAMGVIRAILDADAEKFISFIHEDVRDQIAEEFFDGDSDAMLEGLEETIVFAKENYQELGVDAHDVICEIKRTGDIGEEEEYDIVKLEEVGIKIEEARYIVVETKYELDGEEQTEEMGIPVCKIGGEWYVLFY